MSILSAVEHSLLLKESAELAFRMLRTDSAADRSFDGNESVSTIEEFASAHQLPARWVELRKACSKLVGRADFWYRADLRDAARQLAVEASDILHSSHK